MIKLRLNKNEVIVTFNTTTIQFNQIVQCLKLNRCKYDPKTHSWFFPAFKYKEIFDNLSDIDEIDSNITQDDIDEALSGNPELEISKERRIPDYSLLNYLPKKGKHPNEDFQKIGISKGINRSRYAYFWDMGTGKSYIAAAIIAHRLYKYKDCGKVVFLTTNIGVRNLRHELIKFIKNLSPDKIAIADKNYRNPFDYKSHDIIIMSYNSFRLVCDYYKKKQKIKSKEPRKPFLPIKEWTGGEEAMFILDESHEIMYSTSQRGYLVSLHSELFKYRYLFTGTPADKPEKLYNQFRTLDPWLVYNLSFTSWKEKMAFLGDRFSAYSIREWKKDELEKQNKRFLNLHGDYCKSSDVIDLPDYFEKKIYLELSPEHRYIYENLVMEDLQKLKRSKDIINRFPYMMLAIDNPFLLEKHKDKFSKKLSTAIDKFKMSYMEKLSAIEDIIEDHPDEKIIIWAIHPKTIELIANMFKDLNPITITGDTPQDERHPLVEEFKNKKEHKLLIANITTLNTSETITECNVQIYVERGFSYEPYVQSTRRIYRIGQDKPVITYILIYDNSLDNLVDTNLTSKGMLIEGLVKKDFLTQEEWVKIFNSSSLDTYEE